MFDPSVSDPLVLEHGPDDYHVAAALESIMQITIYEDIAAKCFSWYVILCVGIPVSVVWYTLMHVANTRGVSFTFFATQDIARILRKVKDNFLAVSRRSLAAMALC